VSNFHDCREDVNRASTGLKYRNWEERAYFRRRSPAHNLDPRLRYGSLNLRRSNLAIGTDVVTAARSQIAKTRKMIIFPP
jgi:hypothetical protein